MSDSPTKRRRTRGAMKPAGITNKRKQAVSSSSNVAQMSPSAASSWPSEKLPVELFSIIISFLPRSSIQNMRLVNREFERKVSEYLFRVVVVPFRPEIYGIHPEPLQGQEVEAIEEDVRRGSIMLQDKGMRVFEGFGRHILRFAMSFEFDETKLARPPIKSDQEAITSFWGIYRWPFKKYNRYAQLEGLEQTADETRTMAKALRFIENAQELALSIDGGLGWLSGPDVNQKVVERGGKVVVFGDSRFPPEPKPKSIKSKKQPSLMKFGRRMPGSWPNSSGFLVGDPSNPEYERYQRMLEEAGYEGDDNLEQYVELMMETEEAIASSSQEQDLDGSFTSLFNGESLRITSRQRAREHLEHILTDESLESRTGVDVSDDEESENTIITARTRCIVDECELKPNNLTNAQREMLLETEWAQRAFMQSYAIAIIDNSLAFSNIKAFTIARLPYRHLGILRREDFWDSLPALQKLSIGLIPDWRDVVKLPTSWVQDNRLPPSRAVEGVYQLLNEHITTRSNIKNLHFEWLCGGEETPGLFARNQHILAAPLVSTAMEMVNRVNAVEVLAIPHIQHLSLRNCWISPHVFTKFGLAFRKGALQSLSLDSVSLTATLPLNAQPRPLTANNNHGMINIPAIGVLPQNHLHQNFLHQNIFHAAMQAAAPPAPPANNTVNQPWFEPPRAGSWAHLIDVVTPGQNLADLRYAREVGPEPAISEPTALKKLKFTSCGYVRLPLDFGQASIESNEVATQPNGQLVKRVGDLDNVMMKSGDHLLATIVNHMDENEVRTLENAWNMTIGWDQSRRVLASEAYLDGVTSAGRGRFSGVIEAPASSSSS